MAQDAGQVRQAIEQDRADLADTVQALARKADVKQRVRDTAMKGGRQVRSGLDSAADSVRGRPLPFGAVVLAVGVGLLVGRLWWWNRHRRG
jgi:ElaB/YqjD/DUF883 family membrane-anchored ribosome-binding protein